MLLQQYPDDIAVGQHRSRYSILLWITHEDPPDLLVVSCCAHTHVLGVHAHAPT
jgi:hypothetical protein